MIWLAIVAYALLTLGVCMPAGRLLAKFPTTRGAGMFVLTILFWPMLLVLGVIASAMSPDFENFVQGEIEADRKERT